MQPIIAKKKIVLAAILASSIFTAGLTAYAGPWGGGPNSWGGPGSCGQCDGFGPQAGYQMDAKTDESRSAFLNETTELRKSIAVKKAEKRALMLNDNPDPKRVAELTGEIFDLKEQLQSKAGEKGLDKRDFRRGPGSCGCGGPDYGPGPSHRGFKRQFDRY